MAPTSAQKVHKTVYEGVSILALGATIFKNGEYNFSLKWWTSIRRQDVFKVSRVAVS